MKKLSAIIALCLSGVAFGQTKEGKIIYERTAQLPVRMMNLSPEIAAQIPKQRVDQYELLFANNQSLWQYLPTINSEESATINAGSVVVRPMNTSNDVSYCNFEKGIRVDRKEVVDKSFIVTDSITKLNWKLTGETKSILGHNASKATTTRISTRSRVTMENGEMKRTEFPDTAMVVAWYSTDFPISSGPEFQGQLPGVILELDIANGETVYKAIEISPKVSASKIKEPKDGKKVTAAEYAKEREALMEEMRKNMQGGNLRFRVQQ